MRTFWHCLSLYFYKYCPNGDLYDRYFIRFLIMCADMWEVSLKTLPNNADFITLHNNLHDSSRPIHLKALPVGVQL